VKLSLRTTGREDAAVLIASLFVGGILGLVLGSYLFVIHTQYIASVRSQAWHSALDLAEAGAEEAFAHVNPGAGFEPNGATLVIARAGDHWTGPNNGIYGPISRTLGNSSYTVSITADPNPVIYSTGYVTIPSMSATLSRAVQITTASAPLTRSAVATRGNITMTGTGSSVVFADSFNSMIPYSQGGTNGDVASLSGPVNIGVNVIKGDLFLGPTAIGSGQVRGATSHDLNVDFPEVVVPSRSWGIAPIANSTNNGVIYRYDFQHSGDYEITSPGAIYVRPGVSVTVRVDSDNFEASAIHVAGSGSQSGNLTLFVNGNSFKLSGDAVVENNNPANLTILGTSDTRTIVFTNHISFTGTFYAPSADLTDYVASSRSTLVANFSGALVANSVLINGLRSFHFDENLLKPTTFSSGYVVTSWREL
jgi:hypothetical protein